MRRSLRRLRKNPTYNANKTSAEVTLVDLQYEEQRQVLIETLIPACSDLRPDGGLLNASVILSCFSVLTLVMETVKADIRLTN